MKSLYLLQVCLICGIASSVFAETPTPSAAQTAFNKFISVVRDGANDSQKVNFIGNTVSGELCEAVFAPDQVNIAVYHSTSWQSGTIGIWESMGHTAKIIELDNNKSNPRIGFVNPGGTKFSFEIKLLDSFNIGEGRFEATGLPTCKLIKKILNATKSIYLLNYYVN